MGQQESIPTGTKAMIRHRTSGLYVHPFEGSDSPSENTRLVLHGDIHCFRFIAEECEYGYIEHVSSRMVVHPFRGKQTPIEETELVLREERTEAAWFSYDKKNQFILHKGGLYVAPSGGEEEPDENTALVLCQSPNANMRFVLDPR
ncbi:lectin-like [Gigantopelta aegis]|uniref:lectin-like n=1 Tax=Gigantopelta aegis TaxID=1735272 RepID=UPI001B88C9B2|nr:lectin-like [Gigantopelta aegis]XP_041359616.1 lectin-like [Gigantopelta aegis]